MAKKKPKTKVMPHPSIPPLSSRRRRKPIRSRVTAAVSMDETLYHQALRRAAITADNNFSAYVRRLMQADLAA